MLLRGKVSNRNGGEGKLLVNSVTSVSEDKFPLAKEIHFTIDLEKVGEEKVADLRSLLSKHIGESKIFFHLKEDGRRTHVIKARSQGVKLNYDLVADLTKAIGGENIKLVPSSA